MWPVLMGLGVLGGSGSGSCRLSVSHGARLAPRPLSCRRGGSFSPLPFMPAVCTTPALSSLCSLLHLSTPGSGSSTSGSCRLSVSHGARHAPRNAFRPTAHPRPPPAYCLSASRADLDRPLPHALTTQLPLASSLYFPCPLLPRSHPHAARMFSNLPGRASFKAYEPANR